MLYTVGEAKIGLSEFLCKAVFLNWEKLFFAEIFSNFLKKIGLEDFSLSYKISFCKFAKIIFGGASYAKHGGRFGCLPCVAVPRSCQFGTNGGRILLSLYRERFRSSAPLCCKYILIYLHSLFWKMGTLFLRLRVSSRTVAETFSNLSPPS